MGMAPFAAGPRQLELFAGQPDWRYLHAPVTVTAQELQDSEAAQRMIVAHRRLRAPCRQRSTDAVMNHDAYYAEDVYGDELDVENSTVIGKEKTCGK